MKKDKKNDILIENNISSLQAGFFLINPNLSNKLEIAQKINESFKNLFDDDPTIIPIPEDAPKEIPRIILSSKNKIYSCNISLERIDFFTKDIGKNGMDEISKSFIENANTLARLLTNFKWDVYRIALISQFQKMPNIGISNFIKSLSNEEFINGFFEAQIHKLTKMKLDSLNVNKWLRIISQRPKEGGELLIIKSDINTEVVEIKENIDELIINKFFKLALNETEKTIIDLNKYDK